MRNEKGITLIALIITIIIIIILAMIILNLGLGENGLFKQALDAKDAHKIGEYVDLLTNVAVGDEVDRIVNRLEPDIGRLDDLINEESYVANTQPDEENNVITVTTKDGYILDVVIKPDGDIEVIPQGKDDGEPYPEITLSAVISDDYLKATINATIVESKNGVTRTEFIGEDSKYNTVKDYNNEKDTIIQTFEVESNGTYLLRATSSKGKSSRKNIKITGIRDYLAEEGLISFGIPTWSNEQASVEINKTAPILMQYQVNSTAEGNWQEYTTPLSNLNHGDIVYARLFLNNQGGKVSSLKIEDKNKPTLQASIGEITTNSVQITGVSATDLESGIDNNVQYRYEYKESEKTNYELGTKLSSTSYNYTGLKQNTTYNFKVTVTDKAGNVGEKVLTATTAGLEEGSTAIQFGTPVWSDGKASITISKKDESKPGAIQYQVKTKDGKLTENGWNDYAKGTPVVNLKHEDTVYARLWDGTNAGSTISFEILDTDKPTSPNLQITAGTAGTNGWYTSDVTVTITAGEDLQSGVERTTYIITGAQSKAETQVTSGSTISITVEGTSTITAYTYDNSGKKSDAKVLEVKKDSTKPLTFSADIQDITPTGFTITGSTTDATSEIAKYEYYVNDEEQPSNVVVDKEPDTKYTCYIRAYDKAGNYIDSGSKEVTLEIWRELPEIKTDGSWNVAKGVNSPNLREGMTAIISALEEGEDWYDYKDQGEHLNDEKTSKWANAKTEDGSYWVWIPRYEYKIVSGEHTNTAGEIEVKFIPTSKTTADPGYKIHPAFVADTEVGGFGEELAGIWVGKYESSHADATADSEGSSSIMKILPEVRSWQTTDISDIYTKSYSYNRTLESHQMKNSEWGAVAYLAHSQYGRNGNEVTINNNQNYITGMGGNSVSEEHSTTTNAYYTSKGQLASTTGNIYGVYDMSGGLFECPAAYVATAYLNSVGGSALINAPNKYKNVYAKGTSDNKTSNYLANSGKYGDAIYETSSNSSSPWNLSWFQDYSQFPASTRYVLPSWRPLRRHELCRSVLLPRLLLRRRWFPCGSCPTLKCDLAPFNTGLVLFT